MSKLDLASKVPAEYERQTFADIFRSIMGAVNPLAEGRMAGRYSASTVIPTTGAYANGDIAWDSNPTVAASVVAGVAADYIRLGWVNVASGSPGTFKEIRVLVGSGSGVPAFPASAAITNSLSGDVSLNNTGTYFDGPSVAQGSTGTWFASGTVSMEDTAGGAQFSVKLWDGTTVIASAVTQHPGASQFQSCTLSGFLASPAGNLRISVKDTTSTSGKLLFNQSGNSKDCTITAYRIA